MRRFLGAVVVAVMAVSGVAMAPVEASPAADEQFFVDRINALRSEKGLAPLVVHTQVRDVARRWAAHMANQGQISHRSNLADGMPSNWRLLGENVGVGGERESLFNAFVKSPGHYANLVHRDYQYVGVGVVHQDGSIWVAQEFMAVHGQGPAVAAPPAPPPCGQPVKADPGKLAADRVGVVRGPSWFARPSLSPRDSGFCFNYAGPGDIAVSGDWDGNGTRTPGVFRPSEGRWYLRNTNLGGNADVAFAFGSPGDVPVVGDWNNDNKDTIGVFRPSNGTWYLRNSNSAGPAAAFRFGGPGDIPVVGDWNKNGTDTIGVFRGGEWWVSNFFDRGRADAVFRFGGPGDVPVVGDWNNDGTDTFGVFRGGNYYLTNFFHTGYAEHHFVYGGPGDRPIVWR